MKLKTFAKTMTVFMVIASVIAVTGCVDAEDECYMECITEFNRTETFGLPCNSSVVGVGIVEEEIIKCRWHGENGTGEWIETNTPSLNNDVMKQRENFCREWQDRINISLSWRHDFECDKDCKKYVEMQIEDAYIDCMNAPADGVLNITIGDTTGWYRVEPKENYLTFDDYKEQMKNVKFGEYRKVKETSQLTEITPEIRALAEELRIEDNVIGTITMIELWILENIEYQEDCGDDKAEYWARSQAVLERKYGCCHHKAILAMSLLRANGLYAGYLYEDLNGIYDHAQPFVLMPDGEDTYVFLLLGESLNYFDGTLNRTNYLKAF